MDGSEPFAELCPDACRRDAPSLLCVPEPGRPPAKPLRPAMTAPHPAVAQRDPAPGKAATEHDPLLPTNALPRTPVLASDLRGYLLMALSTIGFSGMSFFVRVAEDKFAFPPTSSVFVRATVHTLLSGLYIVRYVPVRRSLTALSRQQAALLAFRGVAGSVGIVLLFSALRRLPVGDAITIFFTGPVITLFLSNLTLHEPLTLFELIAGLGSFAGVVLVAHPGTGAATDPLSRIIGSAYAFAAAFLSAVSYVSVRSLGTSIHFMMSVFSLSFASIVTSTTLGGAIGPTELVRMREGAFTALLAALFAFSGQCCLNKGLQLCRAGPGVLIRNLDVPLAYILGLLFLGEKPSWFSFFGSLMILTATLMIGLRKIMRS